MLGVPTVAGFAVSRKCIESLLVKVIVGLVEVVGVGAAKLILPCSTRLLPMVGAPKLIAGAETVAGSCTGTLDGMLYPAGIVTFKLGAPAAAGTKLTA
jgi:hypothetical protein